MKYCHILTFMTPKTKYEFFFLNFCYKGLEKLHDRIFPVSSFSCEDLGGRNFTFFIPCLFPGANYHVHSEPAVLDSSSWAKPRISLPTLILLCTETTKKYNEIGPTVPPPLFFLWWKRPRTLWEKKIKLSKGWGIWNLWNGLGWREP